LHAFFVIALALLTTLNTFATCLDADASDLQGLEVGKVHMNTSCSPGVSRNFDIAVALLHNFWYPRALSMFDQVIKADPECAMAYWGAAMTYNHPFWDAPTGGDEQSAWALVQKGMRAKEKTPREAMYIDAVAALYRNGGAGKKSARDNAYMNAMAAVYARYPDDETRLFYALSILGTIQEGSRWSAQQELAARLIQQAYTDDPQNPGALHYMIHVYDDPVHAPLGLKAARAYAQVAPAVPHALHMPSHIFTRLGYWEESAASNERAWTVSESDTRKAGENGAYRDFHSLNYLQYAYLQLGRYKDAKRLTGIFAAQYEALPNKITHPDTSDLEVRHLRGRTIYDLPDRIVYGYFDTLARYIMESGQWQLASALPSQPVPRDFAAMRLQIDAMAAAKRKDVSGAVAAADKILVLSNQRGQQPLVQKILDLQAKEAQAAAAEATGDQEKTIALMDDAVAIEDSIYALSQPPYPAIPAHELYGDMLMEINLPAAAEKQFALALQRTPRRPMAIYGLAQCAQAQGDRQGAAKQYGKFLRVWKNADQGLPAISVARRFLEQTQGGSKD
jgi:hypothetical protein